MKLRIGEIEKNNKGITIVALIVTIIILLILAGVSIAMLTGNNGIFNQARKAKEEIDQATENEVAILDEYNNTLNNIAKGVSVPEGLEVGTIVSYNPSGTYNWQSKYCSSPENEDFEKILDSGEGKSFNINIWRVFDINETTGEVILIPEHSTSKIENGKVTLFGAQGYNNAVYLLDEACSNLYGNKEKGIKARSIDIDDIEVKMKKEALTQAQTESNYGKQILNAYMEKNSNYPIIYEQEILRSIDNNGKVISTGLGISEQVKLGLIEATDNNALNGYLQATSIQPTQTYWSKDNSFLKTSFQTNKNGVSYYELLMPDDNTTSYWIASRCVSTHENECLFTVSRVFEGNIDAIDIFSSNSNPNDDSNGLFPIVSLKTDLISGDINSGFKVK